MAKFKPSTIRYEFNPTQRVGTDGPINAKLMVVGMAPAREELIEKRPLVGPSGRILNNALQRLGLHRKDIFVTNVLHFPLPMGARISDVPLDILAPELERLEREINTINPNVIVPLGEEPLYHLTGKKSMTKWRGSILPTLPQFSGRKAVGSYHPAFIMRGMWKWLSVFTHIDIARAVEESKTSEIKYPRRSAITGPSFNDALGFLSECRRHEYCAFDIETRWWKTDRMGEIACVAFSYRDDESLCIPFIRGNGSHYWTDAEECAIWRAIAGLLQDRNVKKIAQNASFEWIYFWKHLIYPWPLAIDTMTLHHCLYPDWGTAEDYFRKKKMDEPGHGLAFINSQYTRTPYYKDDGKFWSPELGEHQFWQYNCMDAMVTYECAMKMMVEACEENLWEFYKEQYIKPFPSTLRAEWEGTPIDVELKDTVKKEYETEAIKLQDEIDRTVGFKLNVNSPKQMLELLYKIKKYPVKYKHVVRGRGPSRPTADAETLRHFADRYEDPLLMKILRLRHIRDFISDFINQPLDAAGNIHTHYKIGGTDGLRWSSSRSILGTGINLQNIPREGIARRLFTADTIGSNGTAT